MPEVTPTIVREGVDNPATKAALESRQPQPAVANSPLGRDAAPPPTPDATPAPNFKAIGKLLTADEYSSLASDPTALNARLVERYEREMQEATDSTRDAAAFHELMSNPRIARFVKAEYEGGNGTESPTPTSPAPQPSPSPNTQPSPELGKMAQRIAQLESQLTQMAAVHVAREMTARYPDFPEVRADVDALLRRSPNLDVESAYLRLKGERHLQATTNGQPKPAPVTERQGVVGAAAGRNEPADLLDRKRFPKSEDAYKFAIQEAYRELNK